jgi:hypothetical protein
MKLGEEFDAAKFLRYALELGAVILKTELGVIYGIPTSPSNELHQLLVWHNNDKAAVKKVAKALSSNLQLKAAHDWFSIASASFSSENTVQCEGFRKPV